MTDKPILFSVPMVQALLDWRKTQTRRVLKPQGGSYCRLKKFPNPDILGWVTDVPHKYGRETAIIPHQVGDRLWVKEAHWARGHWEPSFTEDTKTGQPKRKFFRSSGYPVDFRKPLVTKNNTEERQIGWYKRNSLFMFKVDSRLTLTVTNVRVQWLQDISEEDAIAEGVGSIPAGIYGCWRDYEFGKGFFSSYNSFRSLINSINGPDTWEANP